MTVPTTKIKSRGRPSSLSATPLTVRTPGGRPPEGRSRISSNNAAAGALRSNFFGGGLVGFQENWSFTARAGTASSEVPPVGGPFPHGL
jgi:hypothetical protein